MTAKEVQEILEKRRQYDLASLQLVYLIASDRFFQYQWSNIMPMLNNAKDVLNRIIKDAKKKEKEAKK